MNEEIRIQFLKKLPKLYEKSMRQGFIDYETKYNVDINYKTFSLVLTNDSETLLGILTAYSAFSEIYVDDLWVDSNYRNKGYGRLLLTSLEQRFEGKGFNNINLVTSAFQAPEFYKKCGYEIEFIRHNSVNPQFTKTFFIKYFRNTVQSQGILK